MGQLLVDRFITPVQLEGIPRKVFPLETVEWEEGSFILRRGSVFYLFTSQGNWRNETYHVLLAKSESITGPYERFDDLRNRPILETNETQIGPGHNSLFEGPEGRVYICYHAWDQRHSGRYAWIAPLEWEDDFPWVRSD